MIVHVLRLHHFLGDADSANGAFVFPRGDLLVPRREFLLDRPLLDHLVQAAQRVFDVAHDRQIAPACSC